MAVPPARAAGLADVPTADSLNSALQSATTADALDRARALGKSILDLSQLTESTATYANPDGTFTSVLSAGPVRLKQPNGAWQDIDTKVVPDGTGRFRAANNKSAANFSAGGHDRALASSTFSGEAVGVEWPTDLPAASPAGSRLTYANVASATDLEIASLPTGYEFTIVIKSRPAGPVTYSLPLNLPAKWTAREDAGSGTVDILDVAGVVRARVGGVHSYGNTKDVHTGEYGPTSDTATRLRHTASGPVVDVTPDPDFLQAAATTYPVHVDPSVTMNDTYDTYVDRTFPSATYATQPDLHAGYYTQGTSSGLKRSFVNFDTSGIAGKIITAATAKVFVTHVWNCATYTTEIWGADATISGTTNWSNAPNPVGHHGNFTFANLGDTCSGGAHAATLADVTSMATAWAANGASRNTMTLKAPNEGDVNQYRKFDSVDAGSATAPIIVVTYNNPNTPPGQVSGRSVSGNTCTGCNPGYTADTTPTLTGTASDADGNTLKYQYELYSGYQTSVDGSGNASISGLTPVRSFTTASFIASGTASSYTVSPALADGKYSYRVRAYDGAAYGVWSASWVQFTVDSTGPVTTIASATHPNQTLWYNNNKPSWTWGATAASPITGYSSALDQTPTTTPDTVSEGTGTSYSNPNPLADGVWYLHIRAAGSTNIWGPATHFKMNIDSTPAGQPASVTSTTHAPNVPSNTKVIHATWTPGSDATSGVAGYSYAFNTSQSTPADAILDVNSSTLSADSPQLGDGTYWLHVRTIDQAGNASSDVAYGPLIIDTAGPTAPAPACAPQDDTHWYPQTSTTCTWVALDGAVGWSYSFDANQNGDPGTTQNTSTPTTGLKSGLTDGTTYLHVRGKDTAGNWGGIGTTALHIDSTAPNAPTITANNAGGVFGDGTNPAGKYYSSGSPLLSWSATDTAPIDAYTYVFDRQPSTVPGTLNTTTSTTYTPTGVADGTWYLHVRARNAAGLWSAASHYAVRVDTTAPNAAEAVSGTHPKDGAINIHDVQLDWSAQPGTDVVNQYGNAGLAGYSYSFTQNSATTPDATVDTGSTSLTQNLADGTWFFNLATVDKAGNLSTSSYGPIRIDTNGPPVTDADRERFLNLWKPRVLSETFYQDWFANPIPASILAEGFHGMNITQKHYLSDQLWAVVMAGKPSDSGLDPAGKQAMYYFVFDKDKAAHPDPNVQSHYPSSEFDNRDQSDATAPSAQPEMTQLLTRRLTAIVPALTPVLAIPSLQSVALPIDLDALPSLPQADVSAALTAAGQTVSDGLDAAGDVVPYALQQLTDADLGLGYTDDARSVFAVPSRLPIGYTACWQSATSSGCKDALLLSTPVDVDVTGDGSADATVTFGPTVPNPLPGDTVSLTNLTLDVKRVAPPLVANPGTPDSDLKGKPMRAHVWIMYDVPNPDASGSAGAGTRLRLGADGYVRGQQLSEDSTITFNITDPVALLTHDFKADLTVHHAWPSSTPPQWAMTAGFENITGVTDPVTAALTFARANDFSGSLQDVNDDTSTTSIDRTVALTATTAVPGNLNLHATGVVASLNESSDVNAQLTDLPAATTFTFHRTYDNASKQDTQDFAGRNTSGNRIPRIAGAMTVNRQGATDRATFRLENTSADFTVHGTSTTAGAFDYTYQAHDDVVSGPVDLSVRKTDSNALMFAMRLASSSLPQNVHASYGKSSTPGDDRTLLNLAASSGFNDVAFLGYDRNLQIAMSGRASQLPPALTGSISPGARHLDLTGGTGSNPAIGLIDAVFSANGGTFSRSAGEHATVNLNGSALGASVQLHGVKAVTMDRPDNTHVTGTLDIDNQGQTGRGAMVGGIMQGLRFSATLGALPDHAAFSAAVGSPAVVDLTTSPTIPSARMYAELPGTGRLEANLRGLPEHVNLVGDLSAQEAAFDYSATSRMTAIDHFMATTDPTTTDRSGTTIVGSAADLPQSIHATLSRNLRSFSATAKNAAGNLDQVGSLAVQAARGGAKADVPAGQHLTLTGTPAAYAISASIDHLQTASASIAADLVHGLADVTLARETGPLTVHYNVDTLRIVASLSSLPKTLHLDARADTATLDLASFSSIQKVIGYLARTDAGPTIGVQLESTPVHATVTADISGPAYSIGYTSSGPTRRAAGYFSPEYVPLGLTSTSTSPFVYADASATHNADGSYGALPANFKASLDTTTKQVRWRDSEPIGQIKVVGTGAFLGGLTVQGVARGVPGDFDATLSGGSKLFDGLGHRVDYLQLRASNTGSLPGRLPGRHVYANYDVTTGQFEASAELDNVGFAHLTTGDKQVSLSGQADTGANPVTVAANIDGLVPNDGSNHFRLIVSGRVNKLPGSLTVSATEGSVHFDSSEHLNGQLRASLGWTNALANADPLVGYDNGISVNDAACTSGCHPDAGGTDRFFCSRDKNTCYGVQFAVIHQALPKQLTLTFDPGASLPFISASGLASGSLAAHVDLRAFTSTQTLVDVTQTGIAEGATLSISGVRLEKSSAGVTFHGNVTQTLINGPLTATVELPVQSLKYNGPQRASYQLEDPKATLTVKNTPSSLEVDGTLGRESAVSVKSGTKVDQVQLDFSGKLSQNDRNGEPESIANLDPSDCAANRFCGSVLLLHLPASPVTPISLYGTVFKYQDADRLVRAPYLNYEAPAAGVTVSANVDKGFSVLADGDPDVFFTTTRGGQATADISGLEFVAGSLGTNVTIQADAGQKSIRVTSAPATARLILYVPRVQVTLNGDEVIKNPISTQLAQVVAKIGGTMTIKGRDLTAQITNVTDATLKLAQYNLAMGIEGSYGTLDIGIASERNFVLDNFQLGVGVSLNPNLPWSPDLFLPVNLPIPGGFESSDFYGEVIQAHQSGKLGPCLGGVLARSPVSIQLTITPGTSPDTQPGKNVIHVDGSKDSQQIFTINPIGPQWIYGHLFGLLMATVMNPYSNTSIGVDFMGPLGCV